jgi:hypothetical protein
MLNHQFHWIISWSKHIISYFVSSLPYIEYQIICSYIYIPYIVIYIYTTFIPHISWYFQWKSAFPIEKTHHFMICLCPVGASLAALDLNFSSSRTSWPQKKPGRPLWDPARLVSWQIGRQNSDLTNQNSDLTNQSSDLTNQGGDLSNTHWSIMGILWRYHW